MPRHAVVRRFGHCDCGKGRAPVGRSHPAASVGLLSWLCSCSSAFPCPRVKVCHGCGEKPLPHRSPEPRLQRGRHPGEAVEDERALCCPRGLGGIRGRVPAADRCPMSLGAWVAATGNLHTGDSWFTPTEPLKWEPLHFCFAW